MEDKIVTIATCSYSRAQLIKGKLESENIECFLSNINLVQAGISAGVKLKIRESDVDVAFKIVEEIQNQSGAEKQETLKKLKSIRRILVPVDFSDVSINACDFALALAHKLKAEIKLLYSYYDPVIGTDPYFEGEVLSTYMGQLINNIAFDARRHLVELKTKIQEKADSENLSHVKISYAMDKGSPADVIQGYIEKYKPGVVVMGTRGADGGSGKFIGSVTRKVIENTNVPVFAIPADAKLKKTDDFLHVLYATNFDDSDFISLRKLMTLVRPFNMKIHCAHIALEGHSSVDIARMDLLKGKLKDEYADFNISCEVIRQNDVVLGLQNYIVENKIDLIALTTHKRGVIDRFFNPSISRKMLFHSEVPLLVFHS